MQQWHKMQGKVRYALNLLQATFKMQLLNIIWHGTPVAFIALIKVEVKSVLRIFSAHIKLHKGRRTLRNFNLIKHE